MNESNLHFIEKEILNDINNEHYNRPICTRFPPEPNGYLHIGNAYAIHTNYTLAKKYGGFFNLRFDDTNPLKEDIKYVESIKEDIEWLGYSPQDRIYFGSDYSEEIFAAALKLIKNGKAYVCDLTPEEMELKFQEPPKQREFGRLNITGVVTSKRYLRELVADGYVDGWDDPRLPTLKGLRRRGYTPASISSFIEEIGLIRGKSTVDIEMLTIQNNSENDDLGSRQVPFTRDLFIEKEDFMEVASKGFKRLSRGKEVRLMGAYFIKCEKVVKDARTGEIIELHCTYDQATKSGSGFNERKPEGTIHSLTVLKNCIVEPSFTNRLFPYGL